MRIIVNPHKIEIIKDEAVNEKEIDISRCYFEFDDEITDSYVKEAYFTLKGNTYKQIIQNNECAFPSEILEEKGDIELGVVAYLVENEEEIKRYNPSPAYFDTWKGSLKDAENSEPITPSEMEQFEQELQNGLNEIDDKIDEVDEKITEIDTKIENIDTAIEETNNLNLDVSDKVDGDVTVTLTKKDASTKTVVLSDGTSLEFNWDGTKLGIKTSDEEEYTYVDLQGIQGPAGPQGEAFRIKKTYSSVAEMNADFNNMEYGDYVMIASTVEIEDNAKLYTRGETQWIFITDFSGSQGIKGETGLTPSIQIGTVVSGLTPSVTRTGTDENPVLNFVLQKGDKGNTGDTGPTGNGISSITKTSTTGLVDTYTITYTNGNTTTFDVSNGNGIDRIEKTATVGNRDTYTIYFTNGETTTYEVSNGEVTEEQLQEEVDRLSMIYNAFPSTSGEGTELTLNGTAEVPFKEINLKGNTSQEGTPTPETPQDIHVVSGDNSINVCGKNLVFSKIANENISSGGLLLIDNSFDMHIAKVTQGETYTIITNDLTNGFVGGFFYDLPKHNMFTYNNQRVVQDNNKTFTAPITGYVAFRSQAGYEYAQLEKGTTASEFEPYKGASYPINLGDIELCKIGDYQDKIDKSTGKNLAPTNWATDFILRINDNTKAKLQTEDNRNCLFFSASAGFTEYDTKYMFKTNWKENTQYTFSFDMKSTANAGNIAIAYTDGTLQTFGSLVTANTWSKAVMTSTANKTIKYLQANWASGSSYIDLSTFMLNEGTTALPYEPYGKVWYVNKQIGKIENYNGETITTSYISTTGGLDTGATVYYVLSTPTTTEITDSTLLSQLEALKKARSYDGQTNITQTNNDLPFIINAEAIMSLKNIFNQGN